MQRTLFSMESPKKPLAPFRLTVGVVPFSTKAPNFLPVCIIYVSARKNSTGQVAATRHEEARK